MTLIEMSVVITILLTLVSVLFIGSQSWKRGSDRAACIVTQRNIQVAVHSFQNLYGYSSGGRPYADYGTQDIARHLFEKGLHRERPLPTRLRPEDLLWQWHLPTSERRRFPDAWRALRPVLAFCLGESCAVECRRLVGARPSNGTGGLGFLMKPDPPVHQGTPMITSASR
jgi:type II secretory pathway pseudopilin PulG